MQQQQQSPGATGIEPVLIPGVAAAENPLATYHPTAGRYDELLTSESAVRPHWQQFRHQFDQLGAEEFARRWNHSRRLIYENGVAYNALSGPESARRTWELDPLPLLIAEKEWETIEAGIIQRAQLLQLVLADLLGPQRLLKEKVLPPQALFSHPAFQLAYHGQQPAGGSFLHYYAGDMVRATDGRWWLMADRTEAPSGIGLALENRIVLSRMLPEVFRVCNVHRLASFFMAFQESMQRLAHAHVENPRVALLTRGPGHGSYFEDAYLARYLGYTLVEGGDLTVRDSAVWLKTLDGLLPIDVILRRPNSESCDPLEFNSGSVGGVAGVLHAARRNQVSISNPLGSGLVESPLFMAFLPTLCHFFLQQELAIPSVGTWWCGMPESRSFVLANLERLIISPAFRRRGSDCDLTAGQDRPSLVELASRIERNPAAYIAQERVLASTAPVWEQNRVVSKSVVLRVYSVADHNFQSYRVMQGGLARSSQLVEEFPCGVVPTGLGSKDAWIISNAPVEQVSLLSKHDEAITIVRSGVDLPSRVADNIYWLGRQIERADAAARLLRKVILRVTSETSTDDIRELPILLRALAAQGQIEPGYAVKEMHQPLPDFETTLPRQVFDTQQPGSLRSLVDNLIRVASLVRDRISMDSWRILVRIDQQFRSDATETNADLTDVLNMCNALVVDLAAIQGLAMENMTRSPVFRFLDIGRRLERALQTAGLLRSCLVGTHELSAGLLESVLQIADSIMTYRSRYLANLQLAAVLDLLVTDETNPRSIAFQLAALGDLLNQLPRNQNQPGYAPYQRTVLALIHAVRMVDVQVLSECHRLGDCELLEDLLAMLDRDLPVLSNDISHRYLVHTGPARKMTNPPLEP